jgi:hypothetical protein
MNCLTSTLKVSWKSMNFSYGTFFCCNGLGNDCRGIFFSVISVYYIMSGSILSDLSLFFIGRSPLINSRHQYLAAASSSAGSCTCTSR